MKASENPFRSEIVARLRYRISPDALEGLVLKVRGGLRSSCLLGPEGTGKTTLLEDLEPLLAQRGMHPRWLRLTKESAVAERRAALRVFAEASEDTCILFDGGEVLGFMDWWRIKRFARLRGFHLIATLHHSRGLPVLHKAEADWQTTRTLVNEFSQLDLEDIAKNAFDKNQGNMREVFRACYWACARS